MRLFLSLALSIGLSSGAPVQHGAVALKPAEADADTKTLGVLSSETVRLRPCTRSTLTHKEPRYARGEGHPLPIPVLLRW